MYIISKLASIRQFSPLETEVSEIVCNKERRKERKNEMEKGKKEGKEGKEK